MDDETKKMLDQINRKLGFDLREYNKDDSMEAHERDDLENPFDKLSMEELLFLREHHCFINE